MMVDWGNEWMNKWYDSQPASQHDGDDDDSRQVHIMR